jgi:hypothetical protein
MFPDERLDKIDERVSAITQSLELLSAMHQENERDFQQRFARNEERLGQLMDTMNRLGNIIIAHEQRLENLEDNR